MALVRDPSETVVRELIRVLGEAVVLSVLKVTATRLKALSHGRGRLTDAQLRRISDQTGRSWMRWGVDAMTRGPRNADQRVLDAATYELLDKIDPVPRSSGKLNGSPRSPRRGRSTQRKAS